MFQPGTAVVVLMIAVAALSRLADLPWNLAPIGALALYCGVYFRNRLVGLAVPLLAMAVSDVALGLIHRDLRFYAFNQFTPFIYGSFAIYFLLGTSVRRHWNSVDAHAAPAGGTDSTEATADSAARQATPQGWLKYLSLGASTLGGGMVFFLVTNFATWLFFPHEGSLAGLMNVFKEGIPFYRATVTGDVVFVALLFGGTEMMRQSAPATVRGWFLPHE